MSRTAKGSGSVRPKTVTSPKGKKYNYYEARATTGYDPITGKQNQRSITGKTQADVRKKMSQVICDVDQGTYTEPVKTSLADWLDTWLQTYVAFSVKPYTLDSYTRTCDRHIKPALGRIKVTDLKALQIQQFYNLLLVKKGLSPKTIKNVHGVLHRALGQALKLGMIRSNPTELCDLPKAQKKEFHPLEQKEVKRFLQAIQEHRYGILYQVTLFTGMRQGEVLGLTWDCVDFDTNTIYVRQQLQKTKKVGGIYTLVPTKNSRNRMIVVAPAVMRLLEEQKLFQESLQRQAGSAWDNTQNLVFTNNVGGHLCHITVYKDYKKVVCSLGLDKERFHDLRHSYAVAAIESGDDIKTVQSNLGHATASFTLNVYGHISQKMRQQSAANMEKYIQNVQDDSSMSQDDHGT